MSCCTDNTASANWGSDIDFKLCWKNPDGTPFDLTGYVASAFEVHPKLAPHLTLTIADPLTGEATASVQWAAGMPQGRVMSFRAKITAGDFDLTSPQIWVAYQ